MMDERQVERWKALEQFRIDPPGAVLTFVNRLCRENGWSVPYAERVLREYKRFAFLAAEAGHPVTPSEDVDQVWHLHLAYTRNYWHEFRAILGKPLHHGPTKGGDDENTKYDDWYSRTRESYTRLFGEAPPADIWPSSAQRFGDDLAWRRVNWKQNLIVPKHRLVQGAAIGFGVFIACLLGCQAVLNPNSVNGSEYLAFYIPTLLVLIVWSFICFRTIYKKEAPESKEVLGDYELAYLRGGKNRLFLAIVTSLEQRGHLLASGRNMRRGIALPAEATDDERCIVELLRQHPNIVTAQKSWKPNTPAIVERLKASGELTSAKTWAVQFCLTALPLIVLFILGVARMMAGVEHGKPTGFLMFSLIVTFATILVTAFPRPLSGRGKGRLQQAQDSYSANPTTAVVLGVALFGAEALQAGPASHLFASYENLPGSRNNPATSSGGCGTGGCSSSGGDGGGGGGGGGCGGCGGGGGGD